MFVPVGVMGRRVVLGQPFERAHQSVSALLEVAVEVAGEVVG